MKAVGRRHHWLVSGTVHFSIAAATPENPEARAYGEVTANALVTGQNQYVNAKRLGQAQTALQMRVAEKVANESIKMEDVVILNVAHLGHMTDEEFNPPEQAAPSIHDRVPIAE